MSKRNLSPVMNRPIKRGERERDKTRFFSASPLNRPVKPLWSTPATIDPVIVQLAPIFPYLKKWFDGRYSRRCLIRLLARVYEQELYGVTDGLSEFADVHAANVALIKQMLFALVWSAEEERAA